MLCVVRWFSQQDGPSSCPCCRREAGELDNVPYLADEEETDYESDDDEEAIEIVWHRAADGTWIRHWREAAPLTWKPSHGAAPTELTDPIATIQSLWRGYTVRSDLAVAGALLALKSTTVNAK